MRSFSRIPALVLLVIVVVFAILILGSCSGGRVYNAPSPPCRLEIPPGKCLFG